MKTIHLFRHVSNEGDMLTPGGVSAAIAIGRGLEGGYSLAVSSGAQRATQTIGCLLSGLGQEVPMGVIVVAALRSDVEDRWRSAFEEAGAGDLASLQAADPKLVTTDSANLAEGLRAIFAILPDDGLALAVGHSPTNEAAVYGLTGVTVRPIGKGESITVSQAGDSYLIDDR